MSVKSAAQYLGIASWQVRAWIARGLLTPVRLGEAVDLPVRKHLLAVEDLDRLVEEGKR